jgi:uncharacterized protein (TIGR03067 family)
MNLLTPIFITLTLAPGGGDITELIKKDRAALQGTWKVVASEDNGEKVPADDLKGLFLSFNGDAIAIKEGGKAEERFSFLLNPTKKPKEMDLTIQVGAKKGQTDRAIYQFDGDYLRICIQSNKDNARPTDFVSRAGSNRWLVVLQKTKEKE